MRILCIEDEPLVADSLLRLLKQLEPGAELYGPLPGVKSAVKWLHENPEPELIISDIQLADGISFDIFSEVKINCPIIFTTAYNEYAIRAFRVNSIDYLLKPIGKDELATALGKFHMMQSKFADKTYLKEMKELLSNFNGGKQYKERFAVHLGRTVKMIPVGEISLFLKEELIYIINKDGNKNITDFRSLDEVEELINPNDFYRANRQNLVCLTSIESYKSDDTGKLTLKVKLPKGHDIIVSKEKASDFKRWFENGL